MNWTENETDRLNQVVTHYAGGNARQMENDVGFGRGRSTHMLSGGKAYSEAIQAILSTYGISPLWWYTGKGPERLTETIQAVEQVPDLQKKADALPFLQEAISRRESEIIDRVCMAGIFLDHVTDGELRGDPIKFFDLLRKVAQYLSAHNHEPSEDTITEAAKKVA